MKIIMNIIELCHVMWQSILDSTQTLIKLLGSFNTLALSQIASRTLWCLDLCLHSYICFFFFYYLAACVRVCVCVCVCVRARISQELQLFLLYKLSSERMPCMCAPMCTNCAWVSCIDEISIKRQTMKYQLCKSLVCIWPSKTHLRRL